MKSHRARGSKVSKILVLVLLLLTPFSVSAKRGNGISPGNLTVSSIITGPEIDIQGNGISIPDEDSTPETADNTDFGATGVSGSFVEHTFRIWNLGDETLHLTYGPPIFITGADRLDFSVVSGGDESSIEPSEYSDFTIRFDPSSSGPKYATIEIGNDDSDENPYNFDIQGSGEYPEMDIYGNEVEITNGDSTPSPLDHTDFGPTLVYGGNVDRTFRIWNHGGGPLHYTYGPPIMVIPNTQFKMVAGGNGSPLPAGQYEDFTVRFDPTGTGIYTATVAIGNDDPDEDPYTFVIQGTGAETILYFPLIVR